MSERQKRERAILDLISSRSLGTQTELVQALTEAGFEVTQATVSREVRRLGLLKKPIPGGGFRYVAPARVGPIPKAAGLSSSMVSMARAESFHVMRTLPGRAMNIAVMIDELEIPEIAGTLAGDDTVLVMVKRLKDADRVEATLWEYFGGDS